MPFAFGAVTENVRYAVAPGLIVPVPVVSTLPFHELFANDVPDAMLTSGAMRVCDVHDAVPVFVNPAVNIADFPAFKLKRLALTSDNLAVGAVVTLVLEDDDTGVGCLTVMLSVNSPPSIQATDSEARANVSAYVPVVAGA